MLESALHYVTTQNPVIWSLNLPWLEYEQIDLTHLEPFEASLGYQSSLFHENDVDLTFALRLRKWY